MFTKLKTCRYLEHFIDRKKIKNNVCTDSKKKNVLL